MSFKTIFSTILFDKDQIPEYFSHPLKVQDNQLYCFFSFYLKGEMSTTQPGVC